MVWKMWLVNLANDLQMLLNLIYLKSNILNLKKVVFALSYTLGISAQKIDKTGLNSGRTGQ